MNMQIIPPFEIKNAFRDPRAVHFQDDIRRAMMKHTPGRVAALPKPEVDQIGDQTAAPRLQTHAENCRWVLRHLENGEDGRSGLAERTGLPERTLDRVLRDLRDSGHIVRRRRDRAALYCITPAGVDVVSVPLPVSVAQDMPRQKKGPSAEKVDAVYRLLCVQPATRTAMQRALMVGASTMEDCLRALRVQELIVWVRDPKTNIKTYMVKP